MMNGVVAELQNLVNGSAAAGDALAAKICRDAIAEIERLRARTHEIQEAAKRYLAQIIPEFAGVTEIELKQVILAAKSKGRGVSKWQPTVHVSDRAIQDEKHVAELEAKITLLTAEFDRRIDAGQVLLSRAELERDRLRLHVSHLVEAIQRCDEWEIHDTRCRDCGPGGPKCNCLYGVLHAAVEDASAAKGGE